MPKDTFFRLPQEKRDQILNSAIDEFSKNTYQDISINHLIASMGIATGSFYQYFVDKKDLYFYVLSLHLDKIKALAIEHNILLNLTDATESLMGTQAHPKLTLDPKGELVVNDQFNEAPSNIIRDWVFEVLLSGNYYSLYDYSIFDKPGVPQEYKDDKNIIISMFIAIRTIVEQFATYSDNYPEYRRLYALFIKILSDGITNPTK